MLKCMFSSVLIVPIAFGQIALTTAQIAKRVSPSVVVIRGKTESGEVLGSGFIVAKDGKIVTNLHVIRDMTTASVQLANGRTLDSVFVLATDERRDLAIIHISGFDPQKHDGDIFEQVLDQIPQRSQILDLGNSDNVSVGEPVVVVGSPQGLEGTVTAGILSSIRDSGEGFKVLQTDAAVNPGNSGGPLVNNKGQAIGVVSFKLRSAEGLNFAVPINYVRGMLNNLHEPVTLDQMRRGLTVTADQRSTGPSLKETLDWLKATIPLSIYQYTVAVSIQGPADTTTRTVPVSFESCNVAFDHIGTSVLKRYADLQVRSTTRYTVPLGALDKGRASKWTSTSDLSYTVDPWSVSLHSKSKVILSEAHDDLTNTTRSETVSQVFLNFNDESIAKRVQEAFNHSADLCRGKEPF
jgi:hypothetical protein